MENKICYFCEEEIYFGLEPKRWPNKKSYQKFHSQLKEPTWRHLETGSVQCSSVATPSNVSLV